MMRTEVGLCVLGLLCLHSSVFGQPLDVQPGVLIFCDDPSVEKAVNSAVTKFNERLSSGHELALFQILSASKSENGSDSVYSLQFTTRRSDCPAGSKKPWTDCNYLPHGRKKPISCNATVHVIETEPDTEQVDCVLDDHISSEKASCLGCPEDIDENSEDLRVPITVSLTKYNAMSDSTHLFTLHNIVHATRQVVAGLRYKARFDMRRTTCAKALTNDLNELCVADDENVEFANCNTTVDVAPWRFEVPQVHLECEQGALPPMLFTRRRPPGWSPLRNFLFSVRPTAPPSTALPPTAAPTHSSGKEESSEEDTLPVAGNDSPFHCPSKPWKAFKPMPKAPTAATQQGTPQPTAEGTFKDTDLLG